MIFIQRFLCRASDFVSDIYDEYYSITHPQMHPEEINTGDSAAFSQIKDYFFGGDFATSFMSFSTVILGLGALFCVVRALVCYMKNDRESEIFFFKIFVGLTIATILMIAIGSFIKPYL